MCRRTMQKILMFLINARYFCIKPCFKTAIYFNALSCKTKSFKMLNRLNFSMNVMKICGSWSESSKNLSVISATSPELELWLEESLLACTVSKLTNGQVTRKELHLFFRQAKSCCLFVFFHLFVNFLRLKQLMTRIFDTIGLAGLCLPELLYQMSAAVTDPLPIRIV